MYLRGLPTGSITKWRQRLGYLSFAAAVGIAALAVLRFSPWLAQVAAAVLFFAWMQTRLLGNRWTQIVSWCGLLLITIPLPMKGDTLLIQQLQTLSTRSASQLLDLFSTPHFARGNVLEVRTGELFVDEACSGVDSLYSLAAIAVMLIVWQQRSFLSGVILLGLVPFWAWLGNLIRIFVIAIMLDRFGIDWTHGWQHTVLGLSVFAGSFAFMLLAQLSVTLILEPFPVETITTTFVHRWYNRCVSWPGRVSSSRKEAAKKEAARVGQSEPAPALTSWIKPVTTAICAIFLVLGGISSLPIMGVGPWKSKIQSLPTWSSEQISQLFIESDLPKDFSGFKISGFGVTHREAGSIFGEHSATWGFQNLGQPIQVSLDFPFSELHPLEDCYVGSGKQLDAPIVTTNESMDGFSAQVHEVKMRDDLKQTSFLWYLSCDADGLPVTRLRSAIWGGALAESPVSFQVQLFVNDCGELNDKQRELYKSALVSACKSLLPKIKQLWEARGK